MKSKTGFTPPFRITVSSDGNVLELTGYSQTSGMYSYKYIQSNTKTQPVTFTEQHLIKFIAANSQVKPVGFLKFPVTTKKVQYKGKKTR